MNSLNKKDFTPQSDLILRKKLCQGFDWGKYLDEERSVAVPVSAFPHTPLRASWSKLSKGNVFEFSHTDTQANEKAQWIASIHKLAGYKALLRMLGDEKGEFDFWCNLANGDIYPLDHPHMTNISITPPNSLINKRNDWYDFFCDFILNTTSVKSDFLDAVKSSLIGPTGVGMRLEVMDKSSLHRNRIGIVDKNLAGRLCVRYEDSVGEDDIFWCHERSTVVHPIGWSEMIGHDLQVKKGFENNYKNIPNMKNARTEDLFQISDDENISDHFEVGMKLEAIDPLKLSSICVATVAKTLKNGYIMISIDGKDDAVDDKCFCHHRTSSSIFPVNFCKNNNLELTPPKSTVSTSFDWDKYLEETKSKAAPKSLFVSRNQSTNFQVGMKLEAVDLMEPHLICVATVVKVVGNLLCIHFDGWDSEYDQWIGEDSPNIFPVGWCELVGHELQPPQDTAPIPKKINVNEETVVKKRKAKKGRRGRPPIQKSNTFTKSSNHQELLTESDGEIPKKGLKVCKEENY